MQLYHKLDGPHGTFLGFFSAKPIPSTFYFKIDRLFYTAVYCPVLFLFKKIDKMANKRLSLSTFPKKSNDVANFCEEEDKSSSGIEKTLN